MLKPLKWRKLKFDNGYEADTLVGSCSVNLAKDGKFKAYVRLCNDFSDDVETIICDTVPDAKKAAFLLYSKAIKSLFKEGTFNENGHERL